MYVKNLAEMSLFHGQVTSNGATVSPVQGVVALGLGGGSTTTKQYLDCNDTNNAIENLQWSKDNGTVRLPTAARSHALRLDLSSAEEQDVGIYIWRDNVTRDIVSINVAGGKENLEGLRVQKKLFLVTAAAFLAVVPAEAVVSVRRGSTESLRVYYSATIDIDASNIIWYDPRSRSISNSSQYFLEESNEVLTITNTDIHDNGVYMIAISRRIFGNTFLKASTMITLNIHGKFSCLNCYFK